MLNKNAVKEFEGLTIVKHNGPQTWSLYCSHSSNSAKDVSVHGIMQDSKSMFTQPFLIPDLSAKDNKATIYASMKLALKKDKVFKEEVKLAAKHRTYIW